MIGSRARPAPAPSWSPRGWPTGDAAARRVSPGRRGERYELRTQDAAPHRSAGGGGGGDGGDDARRAAALDAAGSADHAEHLRGADDRGGDDVPEQGARLRLLPLAAAADDDVPPGDQRVGDAPDPHHRRRGQRGEVLRAVRRGRQRGGGSRDLPDPGGDPVRGGHQRRGARGGGGRALHPRCDARQADGDRRRSERRPDHRRRGAQRGARRSPAKQTSTGRWTAPRSS